MDQDTAFHYHFSSVQTALIKVVESPNRSESCHVEIHVTEQPGDKLRYGEFRPSDPAVRNSV